MFKKNLVVMDGSSYDTLNAIVCIVRMMTGRRQLELTRLDRDHPDMKVLRFRASKKTFNEIRRVIDECWPGLCAFDVAL